MTLSQLFNQLTAAFHKFEDPQLEARHLLLEALRIDLNQLVLRGEASITEGDLLKIENWRDERLKGKPLAYLSGVKAFYKYEFNVRAGVLVPRPETEFVVEVALERAGQSTRIADLGSGSGCIGLTLLKEIPGSRLVAVDSSPVATEVTRENALKLGLEKRVEVVVGTVEEWKCPQLFDLIVANPPYISEGDPRVQNSVHLFEPHEALYAADQGLGALRSWANRAISQLRHGGVYVIEFGSGQTADVQEIMQQAGFKKLQITRDFNGIERVISGIKAEQHDG